MDTLKKIKIIILIFLVFLGAFLIAKNSSATVLATTYPDNSNDLLTIGTINNYRGGQTILTANDSIDIDSFKIKLKKVNNPLDSLKISIYNCLNDCSISTTTIQGTLITSSDLILGSSLTTTATDKTFIFSTPPTLTANTNYLFAIERTTAGDNTNYYQARYYYANVYKPLGCYDESQNNYTGGCNYREAVENSTLWGGGANPDYLFEINGIITPIPNTLTLVYPNGQTILPNEVNFSINWTLTEPRGTYQEFICINTTNNTLNQISEICLSITGAGNSGNFTYSPIGAYELGDYTWKARLQIDNVYLSYTAPLSFVVANELPIITIDCTGGNWLVNDFCTIATYLFIPSDAIKENFASLTLANKFPFAYFYDLKNVIDNASISSADAFPSLTITAGMFGTIPIFNATIIQQFMGATNFSLFKALFIGGFWLFFALYLFHRIKDFDL